MKRRGRWAGLSSIAATLILATSPVFAQEGEGMGSYANPVSFGIFAGASLPVGQFADFNTTGWHAGALLQWNSPTAPFAFRFDAAYHDFGIDDRFSDDFAESMVIATINGMWLFPSTSTVRPYLIGGPGIYNERCSVCNSQTKLGLNGGVGIAIPLSGISTVIEARFHMIFNSVESTTQGVPSTKNSTFIPISVGILFR
jgi:hypothetical protein